MINSQNFPIDFSFIILGSTFAIICDFLLKKNRLLLSTLTFISNNNVHLLVVVIFICLFYLISFCECNQFHCWFILCFTLLLIWFFTLFCLFLCFTLFYVLFLYFVVCLVILSLLFDLVLFYFVVIVYLCLYIFIYPTNLIIL